ncbi:MAG: type II toxin-antitoxin system VapC family toxin [Geobacteraceae bacterium]|jgi:predicted nucleic acid-binding protein
MILVDTSVWVEHLRSGTIGLEALLNDGQVVCHPFIIGEIACGNLKNRTEILSLLQDLPMASLADDDEVIPFIEDHKLMGKGLGYIDIHLLMSALLTRIPLWTIDKRLHDVSLTLLPSH